MTYLDVLAVGDRCQLTSSWSPASPSSLVKVDEVQIQGSLSINTLTSLISHIEVNTLSFHLECQVLDMHMNIVTPPQVSLGHLYGIYNIIHFFLFQAALP